MVLNIFVLLYVIITLTDDEINDGVKYRTLLVLGMLFILPFALTHHFKRQGDFFMQAYLQNHLQELLLKKFLTYEESTRSNISTEEVIMALVRDVVCSVKLGYVATIDMVFGRGVKIVMLLASVLFLNSSDGFMWQTVLAACFLPVLIPVYLMMRQRKLFKLRQLHFNQENGKMHYCK